MRNRKHDKVWRNHEKRVCHLDSPKFWRLPDAPESVSLFSYPQCPHCRKEIHPVESVGIVHYQGTKWHKQCLPIVS